MSIPEMTGNIAKDDEALAEIERLDAERLEVVQQAWNDADFVPPCEECEYQRLPGETDAELLARAKAIALAILAEADEDDAEGG